MRILLTGASSFTGSVLANGLVAAGHEVHAALRGPDGGYDGVRGNRVASLSTKVTAHFGVSHATGSLARLIAEVRPHALLVHAHPMDGFKNADYPLLAAVGEMSDRIPEQMDALVDGGGTHVVYSGSYYEPSSGLGTFRHAAVSPYGLSKAMVYELFRLHAEQRGLGMRKFVIPNPFGPGEDGRFGNYLARVWAEGDVPVIQTPNYVRDNIPVQELVARYVRYVAHLDVAPPELRPSGYIETQGEFARRMAREIGARLGRRLDVDQREDAPHPEPLVIANDGSRSAEFGELESAYWDAYAEGFFS
ncbi:NAD-dependent epimerase/dehydratase family protein [Lacisediminihabitans profunda]|uniref:NAD-dependent epimerase/dehydratase family protein n=1 Tax=Lacisediminihabitans profunda TaxID=2594790 RepID=UPI00165028A9|nr:NAD(P)-dependent oxidoreductase [Lacisediminihabitans profunda]